MDKNAGSPLAPGGAAGAADLKHPSGRDLTPEELAHIAGGGIFDWFEDAVETIGDAVSDAASAVAGAVTGAVDAVGGAVKSAAEQAADYVETASDAISDGVVSTIDAIESGAQFVYNEAVLPVAEVAQGGFDIVADTLVDVFEPLGYAIGDVFTGNFEGAAANFQEGFENTFEAMESMVETAHAAAGSAINVVADLTGEATQFLLSEVVASGFEKMGFEEAGDFTRGIGNFLDSAFDRAGDGAKVGLTSIGNAYGAFIEGASNVPDMISGLSQAVSNVARGDFDGALENLEDVGQIRGILVEGLGEWGKGVDGITDAFRAGTGTVGEAVGGLGQVLVTLTADITARAGEGLGIEEAGALRSYAETVNRVIEEIKGQLGSKASGVGGMAQLDALGAAASAAALLIEGKPEEAGNQFLSQFNLGASAIKAGELAYRSDLGQEIVNQTLSQTYLAAQYAERVAERVGELAEAARVQGDAVAAQFTQAIAPQLESVRSDFTPVLAQGGVPIMRPVIEPEVSVGADGRQTPEYAAYLTAVAAFGGTLNPNLQRDIAAYNRQLAEYAAVSLINVAAAAEETRSTLSQFSFDPGAALAQAIKEINAEMQVDVARYNVVESGIMETRYRNAGAITAEPPTGQDVIQDSYSRAANPRAVAADDAAPAPTPPMRRS